VYLSPQYAHRKSFASNPNIFKHSFISSSVGSILGIIEFTKAPVIDELLPDIVITGILKSSFNAIYCLTALLNHLSPDSIIA